jgi:hypothetical protein
VNPQLTSFCFIVCRAEFDGYCEGELIKVCYSLYAHVWSVCVWSYYFSYGGMKRFKSTIWSPLGDSSYKMSSIQRNVVQWEQKVVILHLPDTGTAECGVVCLLLLSQEWPFHVVAFEKAYDLCFNGWSEGYITVNLVSINCTSIGFHGSFELWSR